MICYGRSRGSGCRNKYFWLLMQQYSKIRIAIKMQETVAILKRKGEEKEKAPGLMNATLLATNIVYTTISLESVMFIRNY